MINRLLFVVITAFIVLMTILNSKDVRELYLYCAKFLPVEPVTVSKHAIAISNGGHLVASFILTCLGYSVFRGNYWKAVAYVAGLAVLGEMLQTFTLTRQAKLEDLVFSFAGIGLAVAVIWFAKGKRSAFFKL